MRRLPLNPIFREMPGIASVAGSTPHRTASAENFQSPTGYQELQASHLSPSPMDCEMLGIASAMASEFHRSRGVEGFLLPLADRESRMRRTSPNPILHEHIVVMRCQPLAIQPTAR